MIFIFGLSIASLINSNEIQLIFCVLMTALCLSMRFLFMRILMLTFETLSCCFEEMKMEKMMTVNQQSMFKKQQLHLLGLMGMCHLLPERIQCDVQTGSKNENNFYSSDHAFVFSCLCFIFLHIHCTSRLIHC